MEVKDINNILVITNFYVDGVTQQIDLVNVGLLTLTEATSIILLEEGDIINEIIWHFNIELSLENDFKDYLSSIGQIMIDTLT